MHKYILKQSTIYLKIWKTLKKISLQKRTKEKYMSKKQALSRRETEDIGESKRILMLGLVSGQSKPKFKLEYLCNS